MSYLLQSQIHESCRLALPEGLKDLMSDISREVLRAQPSNLYQFITDYLAALLVARENLTIACKLCKNVCAGACYPELDNELRFIGLDDENAERAKKVILDYFESGGANETNLMIKIAKKISLEQDQLLAIQDAVRRAFQRNLINNTTYYETSSDSDEDDISRAAKHTLKLYRKTKHNPEEYKKTAENVQKSYRAYGVRRHSMCPSQETLPLPEKLPEKTLRFSFDVKNAHSEGTSTPLKSGFLPTVSSTSLAGSYLNLPKYVPYSVHDKELLDNLEEAPEKENLTIDYTIDAGSMSHRKISFQDVPQEINDQVKIDDQAKIDDPAEIDDQAEIADVLQEIDGMADIPEGIDDDQVKMVNIIEKIVDQIAKVDLPREVQEQVVVADFPHEIDDQVVDEDIPQEIDDQAVMADISHVIEDQVKMADILQEIDDQAIEVGFLQEIEDQADIADVSQDVDDQAVKIDVPQDIEDQAVMADNESDQSVHEEEMYIE